MSYERRTRREKEGLPFRIQAEIARKPKVEAGLASTTGAQIPGTNQTRRNEVPELKGDLALTLGMMAVLITAVVVASLVPEVRGVLHNASEALLNMLIGS